MTLQEEGVPTPPAASPEKGPDEPQRPGRPAPLTLTGDRAYRHVFVRVYGRPLSLTYSQFTLLVRLILARGTTPTGFVGEDDPFLPVAVWRLRKAMGGAAGGEVGKTLVETGAGGQYRLGVPATAVALEPSCSELVPLRFLTAEHLEALRRLCSP
jgi:hypothetical protein